MKSGIYTITSPSGCQYVGSSVSVKRRWRDHKNALRAGRHHSHRLQKAWNKHGEVGMAFKLIMACDKSDLLFYEQLIIDTFKPGYNIALFAAAPTLGRKHSADTRQKMSAWQVGRKLSESHCRSMAEAQKGKVTPPEVREKLSQAMLGREFSEETRAKLSASLTGRTFTEEHRKNMSLVKMGHVVSQKQREKCSLLMTGPGNPVARTVTAQSEDFYITFLTGAYAISWLRENGHPKASAGRVSDVCSGNRKTAYGFRWSCSTHQS